MAMLLEGLAAIALSLAVLMAFAWVVRERPGNSGWVDTIRTSSLGLTGAGAALLPVAGEGPDARQWRTSMFFPLPPREGMAA